MLFSKKKKDITCIDIGAHSIKVARFQDNKNELELLCLGYKELPLDTIVDYVIKDHSIVTKALVNIFTEMNYKPQNIVMTIPSEKMIIKNIEIPFMEDEELAEAIKWEAESYIPFPVEQAKIDYVKIDRSEDMINVLLVAIKDEIIDNYLSIFSDLSHKPTVVNIQPFALLSLLEYQNKLTDIVFIVDMGASGIRIVIGDDKNVYLSRTINIGGKEYTKLLMEINNFNYVKAEMYKKNNEIVVLKNDNIEDELSNESNSVSNSIYFKSLSEEIVKELSRSFKYFTINNRNKEIKKMYITGGGSQLKGIVNYITRELNIEIININPFEHLYKAEGRNQQYAVAIGLGIAEYLHSKSKL